MPSRTRLEASKATLSLARSSAACTNPPFPAGYRQRQTPRLVAACPFTDEVVDTSLTVFVDDLFRVIITDTCRAARVVLTVASNDRGLGGELAGIGVAQHPGKLEFCAVLFLALAAAPSSASSSEVFTFGVITSMP